MVLILITQQYALNTTASTAFKNCIRRLSLRRLKEKERIKERKNARRNFQRKKKKKSEVKMFGKELNRKKETKKEKVNKSRKA